MIYSDNLLRLKNFDIIINQDYKVEAVSDNILKSDIGEAFYDLNIIDIFSKKILFDHSESIENGIKQNKFNIMEIVKKAFKNNVTLNRKIIVRLNTELKEVNYSFFLSVTLLTGKFDGILKKSVLIVFNDYQKYYSTEELYRNHFDEFEEQFDLVKKMNVIGRFVIDFEIDKYKVYGNDLLPELLELKKNKDNFYRLNSRKDDYILENSIIKSKAFYERIDMLVSGKIDLLTDEWKIKDKWLRLEGKVLTTSPKGTPKMIGGIIYDVTDFQNYKDLENIHLFYELAINSGQIGMFHYDLDKHDSSLFTANSIYANLMGIDPDENGMYLSSDFLEAQLPLEEHISNYESVKIQFDKLLKGEDTSTNDDILKIKNLKTGEIKYLLTSSKVDSFFEDGTTKRFGGIVLDITDRIIRERNQVEFLYKDELTLLGNNRSLAKNMINAKDGLGLFFDLDNFKKINDTYGHLMGDKMIKLFGECLDNTAKDYENVIVYRLYGDEFFVFCEERPKSFALIFDQKVKACIIEKMSDIKEKIKLEASMGCSMFKKGSDIDDFIKSADYSMYEAKISKKKREN